MVTQKWGHHVQELGQFPELHFLEREYTCSVVDFAGEQMMLGNSERTLV